MTVTPSVSTAVTPVTPGTATGADSSDLAAASSGLFAQLMAALVPHAASVAAGAPAPDEQPAPDQDQDQAQEALVTPTPPGLVPVPAHPSSLHAVGLPTAPVPGRKATVTGATPATPSSGPDIPPGAAAQPTTPPSMTSTTPDPGVGSDDRKVSTGPAAPAASPAAPATEAAPIPVSGPTPGAPHSKAGAEPAAAGNATATPTSSNAVAPTGVPTPASTSQPASAAAPAPLPVSRQVIPELTRMSTLGEGVHRLTMTLRPEALGEVRVTMTVRDGSLHVRLAAGTEAQHALVPDLTELQQVLKLGSSSDVRVVLRDLAGVPATPDQQPAQTSNQTGSQTGSQLGSGHHAGHGAPTGDPGASAGSGHQNRREAGTPRDINATDGVVDGTSGSRSATVRRARPTGVDLTM